MVPCVHVVALKHKLDIERIPDTFISFSLSNKAKGKAPVHVGPALQMEPERPVEPLFTFRPLAIHHAPVEAPIVPVKKRGRPRKNPVQDTDDGERGIGKRKPGRPRKSILSPAV